MNSFDFVLQVAQSSRKIYSAAEMVIERDLKIQSMHNRHIATFVDNSYNERGKAFAAVLEREKAFKRVNTFTVQQAAALKTAIDILKVQKALSAFAPFFGIPTRVATSHSAGALVSSSEQRKPETKNNFKVNTKTPIPKQGLRIGFRRSDEND